MARVSIAKTENDFYAAFNRAIDDIGGSLITPGDRLLIKPNLAKPAAPDSGQITNPRLIEAVGCPLMGIDPMKVRTVSLAGDIEIGVDKR